MTAANAGQAFFETLGQNPSPPAGVGQTLLEAVALDPSPPARGVQCFMEVLILQAAGQRFLGTGMF